MKSFGEWVAAAHPDVIEENWWKNVGAATAAGLGAAAAGAGYNAVYNQPARPIPGQVAPAQPGITSVSAPASVVRQFLKPGQPAAAQPGQPADQGSGQFLQKKLNYGPNVKPGQPSQTVTSPDAGRFLGR
jgi:hypothetical protein